MALTYTLVAAQVAAQTMPSPPPDAPPTRISGGRPSLVGPIGLFNTSIAEVGPVHQLRLGLHTEYFSAADLLIAGDSDQRLRGGLVFGFTPHKRLEVFGALLNASNRNTRPRDPADQDPEVIKSFGDLVLGGKGVFPLSPAATVGFELGLRALAGVSQLALAPGATSFWLGPLLTYDLRERAWAKAWPLRLHAAASFYVDNSAQVQDLSKVTRTTKEVAMFGYGIARSRLRLALAADMPLPAGRAVPIPLDPFVEYHFEYVTGSADASFSDYTGPYCTLKGASGCIDNRDSQWLTVGLRANVYRQLTVELGADVRIRSPGFPYGVPVPPFELILGVSLPLDVERLAGAEPAVKPGPKSVEPPAVGPSGYLTGQVRSSAGTAVPDAIVAVAGRPHSRVATDPDGGFTTLNLPPGPVELEVSAADFEPLTVVTTVVAGRPENVIVTLRPRAPIATVHGRVTGRDGQGVDATIKFTGRGGAGGDFEARTDAAGAYTLTLPAGTYQARAEARSLLAREVEVPLAAGDRTLDFTLRPPPQTPNVFLAGSAIRTRQAIRFEGTTATLLPASEKVLDTVAEFLEAHGEVKRVQIVAHWDNAPTPDGADALTLAQAEAVKAYLIGRGIGRERLGTVGAGASKPLVPNLTPANQMRNRRIEFHLE